jgi:hypothetical protein
VSVKMSEWQPIETAPKDGTRILAWFSGEEPEPIVVKWRVGFDRFPWVESDESGAYGAHVVTHWMPLPESPK